MSFEQWLQARGYDAATLSDQERKLLQAAFDYEQAHPAQPPPQPPPPQTPPPNPAIGMQEEMRAILARAREEAAAEANRQNEIRRICAGEAAALTTEVDGRPVHILAHALGQGWTAQETELAVLRAGRAKPSPMWYAPSQPAPTDQVLECAALQAGRYKFTAPEDARAYPDQVQQAAHSLYKGKISLQQLLVDGARQHGYRGRDAIRDDQDLRAVLVAGFRPEIRADGFSTSSLASVLANVQSKFLLMGYTAIEQTWRLITSLRSVKDFKPTKSVNLLGDFVFSALGPDGDLKHASVSDEGYANQAGTYGKIHTITRKQIIDDDLSAMSQVPALLGRGAALKINDVLWRIFVNNSTFFTAPRGNLITGATTALSSASLGAALQKFRDQTDPGGTPLGVEPRTLLVPTPLEMTALELLRSDTLVYGGATAAKQPSLNVWGGRFVSAVSAYLSNTTYTGNSTTAWYLLADPADMPVIEAVFLNGQEQPTVQTAEADFDTLGIAMRGYFDFGVAMQNYRGGVKSAGA